MAATPLVTKSLMLSTIKHRICTSNQLYMSEALNKYMKFSKSENRLFDAGLYRSNLNSRLHQVQQIRSLFHSTIISKIISQFLRNIWESILRAVPKKKTSHSKKRSRQRAGKALKDVTALTKCSGCGHVRRSHVLCPYCVKEIKDIWKKEAQSMASRPVES